VAGSTEGRRCPNRAAAYDPVSEPAGRLAKRQPGAQPLPHRIGRRHGLEPRQATLRPRQWQQQGPAVFDIINHLFQNAIPLETEAT
jgi:hypothetical protein